MSSPAATLLDPLRSMFFPSHCAGCGRSVPGDEPLCATCGGSIEKIRPPRCEICSQPYRGDVPTFTCPNCHDEAFHFDCAVAVVRSSGVVRKQCAVVAMAPNPRWKATMKHRRTRPIKVGIVGGVCGAGPDG